MNYELVFNVNEYGRWFVRINGYWLERDTGSGIPRIVSYASRANARRAALKHIEALNRY